MRAIVNNHHTDFIMAVIYDTDNTYKLQFTSMKDNRGATYPCHSYRDAARRFVANCRFYDVPVPHIPTEAEFLGVEEGTLWPKEVTTCLRA